MIINIVVDAIATIINILAVVVLLKSKKKNNNLDHNKNPIIFCFQLNAIIRK